MRAHLLLILIAVAMLAGCRGSHETEAMVDRGHALVGADLAEYDYQQADARVKAARNAAERDAALAERDRAEREQARQEAKARAAEQRLHDEEDHAERVRWRRDAALALVATAIAVALAMRLPLLSGWLWTVAACTGAASAAFLCCGWLVDYRWLVPAGGMVVALFFGIRHLLGHHDAVKDMVKHGGLDLRNVAGKVIKLCQRHHDHDEHHVSGPSRAREEAALAKRLANRPQPPSTPMPPSPPPAAASPA